MSPRPTAAPRCWPYAHPTVEEADLIAALKRSVCTKTAAMIRTHAIRDAHTALKRAKVLKATHTNHPASDSHAPGVAVPSIPVDGATVSSRGVAS